MTTASFGPLGHIPAAACRHRSRALVADDQIDGHGSRWNVGGISHCQ